MDLTVVNAITMLSTKKDAPIGHGISDIRSLIQQLQDDAREWEKHFLTEPRIKPIRDCIEEVVNSSTDYNSIELDAARELYGRPSYKCTKPWCYFFLAGFDTKDERDDHLRQHERPFRCNTDGCAGYQIGFAVKSDLVVYNQRLHP